MCLFFKNKHRTMLKYWSNAWHSLRFHPLKLVLGKSTRIPSAMAYVIICHGIRHYLKIQCEAQNKLEKSCKSETTKFHLKLSLMCIRYERFYCIIILQKISVIFIYFPACVTSSNKHRCLGKYLFMSSFNNISLDTSFNKIYIYSGKLRTNNNTIMFK